MTMTPFERAFRTAHRPPPDIDSVAWIEANIRLPAGATPEPGPIRLWAHQRGIAAAFDDPLCSRITWLKSARIGATTVQSALILSRLALDPGPMLIMQPRDSDIRDYAVEIDTLAEHSLDHNILAVDKARRDVQQIRRLPTGNVGFSAAGSPANFRRVGARYLWMDEISAYGPTAEGPPVALAVKRTDSYPDRRIWAASTPGEAETCEISKLYEESDQRIYEIPCPSCGAFQEIKWKDIRWESERPETAEMECEHCEARIPETRKREMVEAGRWRALEPGRTALGHFGFRLNALVSLAPNAAWPLLAREFLAAKGDPDKLRVFVNTVLGEAWEPDQGEGLDADKLAAGALPFGLSNIPADVLYLTAGVDVGRDRLNLTVIGHYGTRAIALADREFFGDPLGGEPWADLDDFLRMQWRHPLGAMISIGATAIDSGDGTLTQQVLDFCRGRRSRKIVAVKGVSGTRPAWEESKGKKARGRLFLVGVDMIKNRLHHLIKTGRLAFSIDLPARYFEEITAETRVVRRSRGQPVLQWVRATSRARAEALDCTVYAMAVRSMLTTSADRRRGELAKGAEPKTDKPKVAPAVAITPGKSWVAERPGRV